MEYGQFSKLAPLSGSFFMKLPYFWGDPKRDPHLENYPYTSDYKGRPVTIQGRFLSQEGIGL